MISEKQLIHGVPTDVGKEDFTVRVTDSFGLSTEETFSIDTKENILEITNFELIALPFDTEEYVFGPKVDASALFPYDNSDSEAELLFKIEGVAAPEITRFHFGTGLNKFEQIEDGRVDYWSAGYAIDLNQKSFEHMDEYDVSDFVWEGGDFTFLVPAFEPWVRQEFEGILSLSSFSVFIDEDEVLHLNEGYPSYDTKHLDHRFLLSSNPQLENFSSEIEILQGESQNVVLHFSDYYFGSVEGRAVAVNTSGDITWNLSEQLSWLDIDTQNKEIILNPENSDVGVHNFAILATDPEGNQLRENLQINVVNVNDAPEFTFTAPSLTDEDAAFEYQLTASDIDADVVAETLTFEAVTKPDWMTVSSIGLITGTPDNDDVGEHTVTVKYYRQCR